MNTSQQPVSTGTAIRAAGHADVERLADLHHGALGQGLFPQLGVRFLRAYYRTFLDSPHAVVLVAVSDERVTGMLAGTTRHAAHRRWVIRRRSLRLSFALLAALAARPRIARRFLASRLAAYIGTWWRIARSRRSESGRGSGSGADVAVLAHMVVSEPQRRLGAGRRLADAFLERASAAGAGEVRLVTVAGPHGAEAFYERTGWRRGATSRNRDGVLMVTFVRPLP